jgi:hypothetical protein
MNLFFIDPMINLIHLTFCQPEMVWVQARSTLTVLTPR